MTNTAYEQGEGILRLAPAWVLYVYCVPGRRVKLYPEAFRIGHGAPLR